MRLQLKNQLLSKTSDVLSRQNIAWSYQVYDDSTLLININDVNFKVNNKVTPLMILESAQNCLKTVGVIK